MFSGAEAVSAPQPALTRWALTRVRIRAWSVATSWASCLVGAVVAEAFGAVGLGDAVAVAERVALAVGVGVYYAATGGPWWTQDFGF